MNLFYKKNEINKIIRFFGVAFATLFLEMLFYTILFEVVKVDKVLASPVAQVFGVVVNFILNKIFTFKTGSKLKPRELIGYFVVWCLNLMVTTFLMSIFTNVTDIYPTIIRLFIVGGMFFVNFILLNKFVFINKNKENVPRSR